MHSSYYMIPIRFFESPQYHCSAPQSIISFSPHTFTTSFAMNTSFENIQRILVGVMESIIHAPITLLIADVSYRKVLVDQHFFHQIRQLVDNDSFSVRDLLSTVASYFDFETETSKDHCNENKSAALINL